MTDTDKTYSDSKTAETNLDDHDDDDDDDDESV